LLGYWEARLASRESISLLMIQRALDVVRRPPGRSTELT
jgi:hypothetical protein